MHGWVITYHRKSFLSISIFEKRLRNRPLRCQYQFPNIKCNILIIDSNQRMHLFLTLLCIYFDIRIPTMAVVLWCMVRLIVSQMLVPNTPICLKQTVRRSTNFQQTVLNFNCHAISHAHSCHSKSNIILLIYLCLVLLKLYPPSEAGGVHWV